MYGKQISPLILKMFAVTQCYQKHYEIGEDNEKSQQNLSLDLLEGTNCDYMLMF